MAGPVQSKNGNSTGLAAFTITLDSPTTSGNFLEVTVGFRVGGTTGGTIAVTDNKGNTFTQSVVGGSDTAFNARCFKFRAWNITGGSSHQITVTPTGGSLGSNIQAKAVEYSGVITSGDPLDKTAVGQNFNTSPLTGSSGTLSQASELVTCGVATAGTGHTFTAGTGYTANGTASNGQLDDEYQVVAVVTALTGSWSIEANDTWATCLATYKAATGGGTPFTASLSGSTTMSGALTKTVSKSFAGSESTTAALAKAIAKTLTGSITNTAALGKLTAKPLASSQGTSGGLTKAMAKSFTASQGTSGSFSALKVFLSFLSGSIATAGALTKAIAKSFAGATLTDASTLTKKTSKAFAASQGTSASFLAQRVILAAFSGTLTAAGSLTRAIARVFAGAVSLIGVYTHTGGTPAITTVSGRWIATGTVRRWTARGFRRTWTARGTAMLVDNTIEKSPGDALIRLAMNLSGLPEIAAGATITAVSSVTATPTGLTIAGQQVDTGGKSASATFSGGTDGIDYAVTFTLTLSTGQTIERTGLLQVRTR